MALKNTDFPLITHYTVLIYPFVHTVRSVDHKHKIHRLEGSWLPWWSRLEGNIHQALDDTYFFLPYIREVIFPETALFKGTPPGTQYSKWVDHIRRWNAKGLSYYCGELQRESLLRITYRSTLLADICDVEIVLPAFGREPEQDSMPPVHIEWVDAVLFPSGIGFLLIKAGLQESAPRLSHLIDLNYYLRMVHPPTTEWKLPELRIKRMAYTVKMRDLTDFLTQGITSDDPIIPDLTQFMEHMRISSPRRYSETEAGQVYGERCHSFSYACVNAAADATGETHASNMSENDRLLFEFASNIQIGHSQTDPLWVPSPEQVLSLKKRNLISVWRAWRGMALKESVAFLGTEDIPFNRQALPHNVEHDYLPLYLYSLYQKYQLFIFADELMRKGAYVARHLQEVRSLMDRFINFRHKYWFNEVTRKPLGGELYRKFQQGLETTSLYEMVSEQVKDLKEYYEERRQWRTAVLLKGLW